jgi:hypothetical protein
VELIALHSSFQKIHQASYGALESYAPSRLEQVLASHTPEVRVVADQIRKFRALLDEITSGEPLNFVPEARDPEELGERIP